MVLFNYRMRLTLLLLVLCAVHANTKRTSKKTEEKDTEKAVASIGGSTTRSPLSGLPKNAIIAIEVVDPKENTTKGGKGRKRTIESALGYGYNGYQSFFNVKPKPPKYEVYKYSQHDIPAYKGHVKSVPVETYPDTYQTYQSHAGNGQDASGGSNSYSQQVSHGGAQERPNFEVQKSVQYDLGSTAPVYEPEASSPKKGANLQQYYQNGATLFSSLDHNGQLSSLSSQVPNNHGPMVPVIILRVYTNQLGQNALHANIPHGHPYANLNSVDLQSLLAGYVQNNPHSQQSQHGNQEYYEAQSGQPEQGYYQAPQVQEQGHTHYGTPGPVQAQSHQQHHHHHENTGLLTNENYPDDAHTKVIFKKPSKSRSKPTRTRPPQKFKITIPENTYSKVEVQEHTYGGPHDAGQYVQQHVQYAQPQGQGQEHYQQQYYYQQPEQYEPQQYQPQHQQGPQQEYQSSVQSLVQYQQIPDAHAAQKQVQEQHQQHQHAQQVQYAPQQEQPQPQEQSGGEHYDAKQYVQIATYPSHADPEQQQPQSQQQQQQQHQQQAEYYQQYLQYAQQQAQAQHQHELQVQQVQVDPSGQRGHQNYQPPNPTETEVQYLQRPSPEQGTENQEYALVKHSNDAGRDLHPKLFNYHAHGSPAPTSAKKKRERKQRKIRVPLVLAPEVMETLGAKQ